MNTKQKGINIQIKKRFLPIMEESSLMSKFLALEKSGKFNLKSINRNELPSR